MAWQACATCMLTDAVFHWIASMLPMTQLMSSTLAVRMPSDRDHAVDILYGYNSLGSSRSSLGAQLVLISVEKKRKAYAMRRF